MLGMDAWNMMFAAFIGGVFGGTLCIIALKNTNKFNMQIMERYWREDVYYLKSNILETNSRIAALENKISTNSVNKPVVKVPGRKQGKGYSHSRQINQIG